MNTSAQRQKTVYIQSSKGQSHAFKKPLDMIHVCAKSQVVVVRLKAKYLPKVLDVIKLCFVIQSPNFPRPSISKSLKTKFQLFFSI